MEFSTPHAIYLLFHSVPPHVQILQAAQKMKSLRLMRVDSTKFYDAERSLGC